MHLLHVSSGNLYGGVETMLLTLAQNRARCPELETEMALCFEGRLSHELEASGVPLHRLPTPRARLPHTISRARQALAGLLRGQPFERGICHGQWAQAILGPAVRPANVPLAMRVPGPL